ncbi:hypothetical protein ST201phi2-1p267 [Pseudomonas phage 201phi2-1]|uniref:Uncharacterized protein n=1 Tax=Pseudomonas phage 201phi2-1 TaxID=198110 RepID=B3FJC9_BP201|nr:hypothetical protein ST201phi2-1p267 [Pseudomonas phage 201phi2-1]ABY63095.1 hypothetical protein 201phi2-1p267 [Pseudomonas phage 201phi2-1]
MNNENYKKLVLTLLHSYTLAIRAAHPREADKELYHRLIDTTNLTGHKLFEKRSDHRHFIATVQFADGPQRIMTVYHNSNTGKLDVDIDNPLVGENIEDAFEDIMMILIQVLQMAAGVTISESMAGVRSHTSEIAVAIAKMGTR